MIPVRLMDVFFTQKYVKLEGSQSVECNASALSWLALISLENRMQYWLS